MITYSYTPDDLRRLMALGLPLEFLLPLSKWEEASHAVYKHSRRPFGRRWAQVTLYFTHKWLAGLHIYTSDPSVVTGYISLNAYSVDDIKALAEDFLE